ncbi:hypothetical protein MA16_Dca023901 [Dendrobium catenatum]|uniref:Uncharacterized protein n=1 Tax=Dendrobium catenatum TaxID=906689 RepID=A0A2I0XFY0_9ASPA|nr:hypothetical protein MA16_Dca023901 [Dendrobium catenatum]
MDGRQPPDVGGGTGFYPGKGSVMLNSLDGHRSASRLIDGKFVKGDSCDQDLGGVRRIMSGEDADNGNSDKVEDFVADTHLEEGEILDEVGNNSSGRDSKLVINSAEEIAGSSEEPSKIIGVNTVSGRPITAEGDKGCEGILFVGRLEKEAGSSGDLVKRKLAKELRALGPMKISSGGRCVDGGSKKKGGGSSPKQI